MVSKAGPTSQTQTACKFKCLQIPQSPRLFELARRGGGSLHPGRSSFQWDLVKARLLDTLEGLQQLLRCIHNWGGCPQRSNPSSGPQPTSTPDPASLADQLWWFFTPGTIPHNRAILGAGDLLTFQAPVEPESLTFVAGSGGVRSPHAVTSSAPRPGNALADCFGGLGLGLGVLDGWRV